MKCIEFYIDIIVERNCSELVPWNIDDDNSHSFSYGYDDEWQNDLGCIETETWPLLIDSKKVKFGDTFRVYGKAKIEFIKTWTDCGYEYDANLLLDGAVMEKIDASIKTNNNRHNKSYYSY